MEKIFKLVEKQLEKAGFDIDISACGKTIGYFDGRLQNGIFGVLQILNEHESEIRLNSYGHLVVKIPNTEVFAFIHQMSK